MADSKKQKDISNLVGSTASVSGLVASISIVVTFLFDWGFFYALGISFSEAPTTISDHVQSWLIWLPKVTYMVVLLLLGSELYTFLSELLKSKTDKEFVESSRNPSPTRTIRENPVKQFYLISGFLLGPILIIIWILFGEVYVPKFMVLIGAIFTWLIFLMYLLIRYPRIKLRYSRTVINSLIYIPTISLMIFQWGYVSTLSSESDYLATIESIDQRINSVRALETKNIILIRSFENWLLIRDENNRISWIHMNNVHKLVKLDEKQLFLGLVGNLLKHTHSQNIAERKTELSDFSW